MKKNELLHDARNEMVMELEANEFWRNEFCKCPEQLYTNLNICFLRMVMFQKSKKYLIFPALLSTICWCESF